MTLVELETYVNSKGNFVVRARGELDEDCFDKVHQLLEQGLKLPNTIHFLSGYVMLYPPGIVKSE